MSRIGKLPVALPSGVTATIEGQNVAIKGPKGALSAIMVDDVVAVLNDGEISITPRDETKRSRSMWGTYRTVVANMVEGVSTGYTKTLEINGVGYRAQLQGRTIKLALGFSHDVNYPLPEGIDAAIAKPTEIVLSGIDKQKIGQTAAEIRRFRPPEPFKGKGVKYAGEHIFRKEGKKK
ncbi:MAG: 50S ribosomal protein L6 [Alphaproteobacteria bacterium]